MRGNAGCQWPVHYCFHSWRHTATGHPSCLDLPADLSFVVRKYAWQCMDCKTCLKCESGANEARLLRGAAGLAPGLLTMDAAALTGENYPL